MSENSDIFRNIIRIKSHTEHHTVQCIVFQNGGWRHQDKTADSFITKFSIAIA